MNVPPPLRNTLCATVSQLCLTVLLKAVQQIRVKPPSHGAAAVTPRAYVGTGQRNQRLVSQFKTARRKKTQRAEPVLTLIVCVVRVKLQAVQ